MARDGKPADCEVFVTSDSESQEGRPYRSGAGIAGFGVGAGEMPSDARSSPRHGPRVFGQLNLLVL
jgi:hypothetical protein